MMVIENERIVNSIFAEVERLTGVTRQQLMKRSRAHTVIFARQGAMYLMRQHTTLTLMGIGKVFGGYDHSTIIHACNAVEYAPQHDNAFKWVKMVKIDKGDSSQPDLRKQYAIRALQRIREIHHRQQQLSKLGVDLIEYEDGVNLLEESISLLFTTDSRRFDNALQDVQWWLYDKVNKVITIDSKNEVDVNKTEDFIDWLAQWYGNN